MASLAQSSQVALAPSGDQGSLIFTRPWFKDYKNYDVQPPLRLSRAAYEQMPSDLRPLFSWWMTERHVKALERSVLLAG